MSKESTSMSILGKYNRSLARADVPEDVKRYIRIHPYGVLSSGSGFTFLDCFREFFKTGDLGCITVAQLIDCKNVEYADDGFEWGKSFLPFYVNRKTRGSLHNFCVSRFLYD